MASSSTRETKMRARRCLFGKPQPQEVDKWLDENATRMAEEASAKWAFDFRRERPIDQPGPSPRPIDYEAMPAELVPMLYRTRTYRNTTPEGQPPPSPVLLLQAPMKTRGIGRRVKETEAEELREETATDQPSTSHGRPVREKRKEKETNLRQARITNYLAPRKRPSMEKDTKGTGKMPRLTEIRSSASSPSPAPPSPFRFADDYSLSMKGNITRRITRAISSKNL